MLIPSSLLTPWLDRRSASDECRLIFSPLSIERNDDDNKKDVHNEHVKKELGIVVHNFVICCGL